MMVQKGLEAAWHRLRELEPALACRNARAEFEGGYYLIESLGMRFSVAPEACTIEGIGEEAKHLSERHSEFLGLCLVNYLAGAMDIPQSGRLIKPESLKGGHHFFKTTHALPLAPIASRYDGDDGGFINKGVSLGGRAITGMGDAAVEIRPLPRIPLTIILWFGDEEFPPRADLLFDSSAEFHLALDILWSAAMLGCLAMQ